MIKAGIVGATGYAGQQLLWILDNHDKVDIKFISSNSFSGNCIGDIYRNYKKYFEKKLISMEDVAKNLADIDVLFLALPHGMSEKLAKEALEKNKEEFELNCSNISPKLEIEQITNKKNLVKIFCNMYFSNNNLDQIMYYDFIDLITPIKINEGISTLKFDDEE